MRLLELPMKRMRCDVLNGLHGMDGPTRICFFLVSKRWNFSLRFYVIVCM